MKRQIGSEQRQKQMFEYAPHSQQIVTHAQYYTTVYASHTHLDLILTIEVFFVFALSFLQPDTHTQRRSNLKTYAYASSSVGTVNLPSCRHMNVARTQNTRYNTPTRTTTLKRTRDTTTKWNKKECRMKLMMVIKVMIRMLCWSWSTSIITWHTASSLMAKNALSLQQMVWHHRFINDEGECWHDEDEDRLRGGRMLTRLRCYGVDWLPRWKKDEKIKWYTNTHKGYYK